MITDRFIKSYAVIKSQWFSGSILNEYIPFIATIIITEDMKTVDEFLICQKMQEKYDLTVQPSFIRMILSHAIGRGLIKKIREQYIPNAEQLKLLVIRDDEFDNEWEQMISEFMDFCASTDEQHVSKETVQNNIIEFIDHYDDHILYNNIDDIDIKANSFVYLWCKFIQFIKESNQTIYSFILGLCSANLLKNTLFYTSESNQNQTDVTIYLDTPMIFALLDMDTIERKNAYYYIVKKAKKSGMEIKVFDHNIEEVRGIIDRAAKWAHNGLYDPAKANKVAEYLHDNAFEEIEITELVNSIETKLMLWVL